MIATISTLDQIQSIISPEVMALALDKTVAAQIIAWDTFGEISPTPEQITGIFTNHDILKFELDCGGAILVSADQFLNYWEQIKATKVESEPTQETIVSLAKTSGTAIWEQGTKLGYVARYKNSYYAVTEVLTYGKGFQYSYSRHGSFQLACDALVEQSYEEVA